MAEEAFGRTLAPLRLEALLHAQQMAAVGRVHEARVQQAVQRILDPLVGAGNSAVTVTAQLGTASSQTTTETFSATPTTPPLASSTKTEQYTGSGGAGAAGVLGPDNVSVPSGTAGSGTGTYSSTSTDVTNSVNKSTQVVTTPPGGVQRQSVSVAVDAVGDSVAVWASATK